VRCAAQAGVKPSLPYGVQRRLDKMKLAALELKQTTKPEVVSVVSGQTVCFDGFRKSQIGAM
jgi:major membrane immunogen (membrane-anchored lipoprotein)